ncbi:MAG: HlyD family secretion protein [Pseudorhodoferax sp.]
MNAPVTSPPPPAATPVAPPPAPAAPPEPMAPAANRRRLLAATLFGLVGLLGVLIVLYAWRLPPFTSPVQSTENAMVRGLVTLISPQLSGYVAEVRVQDFQQVERDQLLVRIDDRIFRQRVAQAQAQVATAQAALANAAQQRRTAQASIEQGSAGVDNARAQAVKAQADLQRVEELVADGSLSLRERDQSRAAQAQAAAQAAQARASLTIARENLRSVDVNRGSLQAALENAEAALQLARIDLANTEIRAPRAGQLGQVSVRVGAYVSAGTQLTALVPSDLWIVANMKETQMAHIVPGLPVTFLVDALEHAQLGGHVERISPASGSEFSVIAPDNATGNFVKIAQRIPVRIRIDDGQELAKRLRPGMSVVVRIDTSATPVQPAGGQAVRP